MILSAHKNTGSQDKVGFYDTWAENYEQVNMMIYFIFILFSCNCLTCRFLPQQDVALLDYRAPLLAAECISSFVKGDREKITVLDVACGTGLASAHVRVALFQS